MKDRRTVYLHKGYRLRSYTELMWARALDAVDIFYLYEPHLQRVEGGSYLPDFYLPNVGVYLEVKGRPPSPEEIKKADDVMSRTGTPVVFLVDRPQSDQNGLMNCAMLSKGAAGWTSNVCPHDLDQIYKEHAGTGAWVKLLVAVREDDNDYVRQASDIVEEYLMDLMGRSVMETHLRMTHMRVNEQRSAEPREISMAERGLRMFADRQAARRALEAPSAFNAVSANA